MLKKLKSVVWDSSEQTSKYFCVPTVTMQEDQFSHSTNLKLDNIFCQLTRMQEDIADLKIWRQRTAATVLNEPQQVTCIDCADACPAIVTMKNSESCDPPMTLQIETIRAEDTKCTQEEDKDTKCRQDEDEEQTVLDEDEEQTLLDEDEEQTVLATDATKNKTENRLVVSNELLVTVSPVTDDNQSVQSCCFQNVFESFTTLKCKNKQVKLTDLCYLLGHTGTCATKKLKHAYTIFAKLNDLPSYTLHRYVDAQQTDRRREAWLETWAAFLYLRTVARTVSARNFVNRVDSEILNCVRAQVTSANDRLAIAKEDASRFATLTIEEDLQHARRELVTVKANAEAAVMAAKQKAQEEIEQGRSKANAEVKRFKRNYETFLNAMICNTDIDKECAFQQNTPLSSTSGVYVLELNTAGRYYVGQSQNILRRLEQHKNGECSAAYVMANGGFMRTLQPMTPPNQDFRVWEQNETICRMMKHGISNVRGFEFTSVGNLPLDKLITIKTLFFGFGDFCRKCGRRGHYERDCVETTKVQWLQEIDTLIHKGLPPRKISMSSMLQSISSKESK